MLKIDVALPNGHSELFTLPPSSTVQDVRTKAQRAFGKKYLRLVTAKNRVLVDPDKTLEEAEIEDGECLTALVLQPQLAATYSAFALWCHGYNTVTWGAESSGGNSSAVQEQLRGVQKIKGTGNAFAAILEDESVVTWGAPRYGADSSAIRGQLKGVQEIQATPNGAFAAILADGSVPYLGFCRIWRWQFCCSKSAEGCAADSSRIWGLCCHSGRWIRRDLGWCRLWR